MEALRQGCPWDRRQTLESMRAYLLEEAYEVLDALDRDDPAAHCEELGDLLFQIVFQALLREEQGAFALADVIEGIRSKLVRRHPHVFEDVEVGDPDEVAARWERAKAAEGKGGLDAIPAALPALMQAEQVGKKVARVGFDWPAVNGPLEALREEVAELEEAAAAGDAAAAEAELGDVLFAAVNVARHLDVNPELALRGTTGRFLARFRWIEARLAERGATTQETDLETLDALWDEAKVALAEGS